MNKIKEILDKYDVDGLECFKATVEELCKKGVAKGCYQDYGVLADVVSILTFCESYIKENNN